MAESEWIDHRGRVWIVRDCDDDDCCVVLSRLGSKSDAGEDEEPDELHIPIEVLPGVIKALGREKRRIEREMTPEDMRILDVDDLKEGQS